jgi:hypothetical protein
MKLKLFLTFMLGVMAFTYGLVVGVYKTFPYSEIVAIKKSFFSKENQWDLTEEQEINGDFTLVNTSNYSQEIDTVASTVTGNSAPLIVSLHTWSGNYLQPDPLASRFVELGFNYIHPNFQGANNNENSCLSSKTISDIDSAIDWAIENGSVDTDAIYVIGASGGGYTALGYASHSKHQIRHTYAWVPITNLHQWYLQSRSRKSKYADDILGCIGSNEVDSEKLLARSPINMAPIRSNRISIYAGIEDGYVGSVPISHSINYFNKFANEDDKIRFDDALSLVTRAVSPIDKTIGERRIFLDKNSDNLRLTIFNGGHEMLEGAALNEILSAISSE